MTMGPRLNVNSSDDEVNSMEAHGPSRIVTRSHMTVIRPKHIYNFCLFHAYLGDISMCFSTLSYLFQHIWTNLLTQRPSASFCLLLSVHCRNLPIYKMLRRIGKIY